jgi:hypothetical protein
LLDLEYAGWDNPIATAAIFVTAQTSVGISDAQVESFLSAYRAAADLTDAEWARYQPTSRLMEVSWVGLHLSMLTAERLAPKRFAALTFDPEAYRAEQIERLGTRLERVRRLLR